MLNNWVGLLDWLPAQAGLLDGLCGFLGSVPGFLEGQDGGNAQLLGRAGNLLPCPGWVVERAPSLV